MKKRPTQNLNTLFPELTPAHKALAVLKTIPPDELRAFARKHPEQWRDVVETLLHLSQTP